MHQSQGRAIETATEEPGKAAINLPNSSSKDLPDMVRSITEYPTADLFIDFFVNICRCRNNWQVLKPN